MRLTVPVFPSSSECIVGLCIVTRPPTLITGQFSHPSQDEPREGETGVIACELWNYSCVSIAMRMYYSWGNND